MLYAYRIYYAIPLVFPPEITITPIGIPAVGQIFHLSCSVTPPPWMITSIQPNIKFIIPTDTINNIIVGEVKMVNGTFIRILQFNTLQVSHGGMYTCQATLLSTTYSVTEDLSVKSKCS